MVRLRSRLFAALIATSAGVTSGTALAQTDPEPEPPPAADAAEDLPPASEPTPKEEPAPKSEREGSTVGTDGEGSGTGTPDIVDLGVTDEELELASASGIREADDRFHWFLGFRFRNFIIPKFMINMFVEGGATVNAFSFGPELTARRGPLEFDFALTYADFSMDPFMFKERGDPDRAIEKVSSDMKLLAATVDIMGNIPIDKDGRFSFLVGGGVGVAGVLGDLSRSQAYPAGQDNGQGVPAPSLDQPGSWGSCSGNERPPVTDREGRPYCDGSNNRYAGYNEPSWANGGGKPFLVPYFALPHIAFRAKPLPNTQLRVDTGFSITGFFFGLAAGYQLPI